VNQVRESIALKENNNVREVVSFLVFNEEQQDNEHNEENEADVQNDPQPSKKKNETSTVG
jgi:hypothetical protein